MELLSPNIKPHVLHSWRVHLLIHTNSNAFTKHFPKFNIHSIRLLIEERLMANITRVITKVWKMLVFKLYPNVFNIERDPCPRFKRLIKLDRNLSPNKPHCVIKQWKLIQFQNWANKGDNSSNDTLKSSFYREMVKLKTK